MTKNPTKLVSVLIPTNRPADINARCINLLLNKASNPDDIEFLFRIDYEDDFGQPWCDGLIKDVPEQYHNSIHVIQGSKMFGYCSNQDFCEEMYAKATGEFLFLTNDDIDDISLHWDKELERFRGKVCILKTVNPWDDFDHPIISRKWREVNGTYGYHTWEKYFPEMFGQSNIVVTHNPVAEMGLLTSSRIRCVDIKHPDYKRTKHEQLDGTWVNDSSEFGKGQGEMRQTLRIQSIDVPKMKEWLRKNPEWQLTPEPWVNVSYMLQ